MTITSDTAVEIAKKRAEQNGRPIGSSLTVTSRRNWSGSVRNYIVQTDPRLRGTRLQITVDAQTGAILSEGYIPR